MSLHRLATLGFTAGANSDKVWVGAVERRTTTTGAIGYRYVAWWGKRNGTMQTLRNPRPYGSITDALTEFRREVMKKRDEGYQHIDWMGTRYMYGDLRSTIRRMADGSTIPRTDQTTPRDPRTLAEVTDEGTVQQTQHVFSLSSVRRNGAFICGVAGCGQVREHSIHQPREPHEYTRAPSGFCLTCRQPANHSSHTEFVRLQRMRTWRAATQQQYRWNGSGRHEWRDSEHVDENRVKLCAVCADVQTARQHRPITRDEWRAETGERWRNAGEHPHVFVPSEWRTALNNPYCAECAMAEHAGTIHNSDRVWAYGVYTAWLERNRPRHVWIDSEHVLDGVVLCQDCGQELDNSRGFHIIVERIEPPKPIEYQPIIRRRRDINI